MKNSNKIITDDIKVSEIVDNLVAEGQEEFISGDENQVTFEVDESSKELMDLIAEQAHQAELQGEEGSSFDTFITGDESSFAQTVLEQQDGNEPSSLPVDTDNSNSNTDTLSGSILGGGGLSHLSAAPLTGPLSGEALPGETTASSGVSNVPGRTPNEAAVDGLFGIPIENLGVGSEPPPPIEVARVDNTLAVDAPTIATETTSDDDCPLTAVGESRNLGLESSAMPFFSFDITFSELLSNDIGDGVFIKSIAGVNNPLDLTSDEAFSFMEDGAIVDGFVTNTEINFSGSTMNDMAMFSITYEIGLSGNPNCCDTTTIDFTIVPG